VREYEPKIQKLLDDHVVAMPAETIIELVNINDPAAITAVVEEAGISSASKADRIASATRRTISERMEEDPAIYRRFSEMLEETIRDYREKRISERDYLNHVLDLTDKVTKKDRGRAVPASIKHDDDAQACFGLLDGMLVRKGGEAVDAEETAEIAQSLMAIVKSHLIVDVWSNAVAQNEMISAIEDYCYDVLRDEKEIPLAGPVLDDLEQKVMNLARARFPS
jgi:type I restriction enzyme R subunit